MQRRTPPVRTTGLPLSVDTSSPFDGPGASSSSFSSTARRVLEWVWVRVRRTLRHWQAVVLLASALLVVGMMTGTASYSRRANPIALLWGSSAATSDRSLHPPNAAASSKVDVTTTQRLRAGQEEEEEEEEVTEQRQQGEEGAAPSEPADEEDDESDCTFQKPFR
jgi:hypothetical protein